MSELPSNPCDATMIEVAAAIRDRHVSSREVTEYMIARLRSRGGPLNAVAGMDEQKALQDADGMDQALAEGVLAGVPLAHKDMFYRPGRPSECGSRIRKGFMPDQLSGALRRLDACGALDVARLNMAEFAFGVTGHNEITGHVRNPWNPTYMTGGSSSGSGAMVAARATFGALGSDTGGSVRLPAACCGVVGMKVTVGRVSRYGAMPLSHSLDTIGPLTRTVTDNALMLSAIAGFDPDDASSADIGVPNYVAECERGVEGLRIGLPLSYFGDDLPSDLQARFDDVRTVLETAGAEIVDVDVPEDIAVTNALTSLITSTEGGALHQHWLETRGDEYGAQTFGRLAGGLTTPASRYIQALNLRAEFLAIFEEMVFSKVDVLMTPMMVIPVPTIADSDVGAGPGATDLLIQVGHCSRPVNFLGLPGLSIPTGFDAAGLPTSVQFIGRPFDEATLYRVGSAYERETEWHKMAPNCTEWETE